MSLWCIDQGECNRFRSYSGNIHTAKLVSHNCIFGRIGSLGKKNSSLRTLVRNARQVCAAEVSWEMPVHCSLQTCNISRCSRKSGFIEVLRPTGRAHGLPFCRGSRLYASILEASMFSSRFGSRRRRMVFPWRTYTSPGLAPLGFFMFFTGATCTSALPAFFNLEK